MVVVAVSTRNRRFGYVLMALFALAAFALLQLFLAV